MSEFKDYTDFILQDIDSESKKDIEDEIEDHLELSKQDYITKGYSETKAIEMAIKSFGEAKKIKNNYARTFNTFNKAIRKLTAILFVPYILLFTKLSFFSIFSHHCFWYWEKYNAINLTPFKSISFYLFNYNNLNYSIWFNNLFGMVIAFIPFGFLISIVYTKIKRIQEVIVASILFSVLAEVLQYITRRGIADIDDIILSTIGSILGYFLLKLTVKIMLLLKDLSSNMKIVETDNSTIYKE